MYVIRHIIFAACEALMVEIVLTHYGTACVKVYTHLYCICMCLSILFKALVEAFVPHTS